MQAWKREKTLPHSALALLTPVSFRTHVCTPVLCLSVCLSLALMLLHRFFEETYQESIATPAAEPRAGEKAVVRAL